MTYNLSETTNVDGENGEGGEHHHHHQGLLNRTNSLLVAEELLNEINHASLANNHNMSYNDNMNISEIQVGHNQHAADFIQNHMSSQLMIGGEKAPGHLHRTREVENLVTLDDEQSCDALGCLFFLLLCFCIKYNTNFR